MMGTMATNKPNSTSVGSVLILASTWWPLTARLAVSLLEHGSRVSALCPPGHPLSTVRGITAVHLLSGIRPMQSLHAAILADKPDVIVPGDDTVVWQLHRAHELYPEFRPLIERSLGDPANYGIMRSRDGLLQVAMELGIRTPANAAIHSTEDLTSFLDRNGFPSVMKVDGSFSGRGVEVVHSMEECYPVLERFKRRSSMVSTLGRWLINRNPLALWSWRQVQETSISVQKWIPGKNATAMYACWNGKVLGDVVVEVLATRGEKGASIVVLPIRDAEISDAGRLLAERLRVNGFFGLDFILEEGTRKPYLLELNPRCTQLGHLGIHGNTELAAAFAAAISGKPVEPPVRVVPDGPIAFFPQALDGNPDRDDLLAVGYLDMPVDQPELVTELRVPKAWPERQWLSRFYHRLSQRSATD
jgi:hypothetical protein